MLPNFESLTSQSPLTFVVYSVADVDAGPQMRCAVGCLEQAKEIATVIANELLAQSQEGEPSDSLSIIVEPNPDDVILQLSLVDNEVGMVAYVAIKSAPLLSNVTSILVRLMPDKAELPVQECDYIDGSNPIFIDEEHGFSKASAYRSAEFTDQCISYFPAYESYRGKRLHIEAQQFQHNVYGNQNEILFRVYEVVANEQKFISHFFAKALTNISTVSAFAGQMD